MSNLLKTYYKVIKPPLGSQIDWSHPLSRGLVGCWLMNEGGGNIVNDYSYHRKGTLSNIPPDWKINGLQFGANKQISLGTVGSLYQTATPRSVVVLCKIFSSGATSQFLFGSSDSSISYTAFFLNNSTVRFFVEDVGAGSLQKYSSTTITLNKITMLTMTWDGSQDNTKVKIYIDGKEVSYATNQSAGSALTDDSGMNLSIGNGINFLRPLNGIIYYVFYYNRIITPSEIKSLHISQYQMIAPRNRFIIDMSGGTPEPPPATVTPYGYLSCNKGFW